MSQRHTTAGRAQSLLLFRRPALDKLDHIELRVSGDEGGSGNEWLELAGMRADVALAIQRSGMSERQACKLVNLDRSSYRYEPAPDLDTQLRQDLIDLARQKPRYDYRQLHALLTTRGHSTSPQRLFRLYTKSNHRFLKQHGSGEMNKNASSPAAAWVITRLASSPKY